MSLSSIYLRAVSHLCIFVTLSSATMESLFTLSLMLHGKFLTQDLMHLSFIVCSECQYNESYKENTAVRGFPSYDFIFLVTWFCFQRVNFGTFGTFYIKTQPELSSMSWWTKSGSNLQCYKVVWAIDEINFTDTLQTLYSLCCFPTAIRI